MKNIVKALEEMEGNFHMQADIYMHVWRTVNAPWTFNEKQQCK